jgi:hypothetical protein
MSPSHQSGLLVGGVSTGETKLLIIRNFPRGGKPANIDPERTGEWIRPVAILTRRNQVNVFLSNEKNCTIRYKASARHSGNFGSIDRSFAAGWVRSTKV